MAKGTVLLADDDAAIRTVLNQSLTRAGFEVRLTSNVSTLWQWIEEGLGDCVVSDVIMPDGDAFELMPKIKALREDLPVILISAQNTFMTALKAEEADAYEYLPKPFDLDKLTNIVDRAVSEPKDNRPVQAAEEYIEAVPLVGRSVPMQELYRSIARLTSSDLSVMLSGESGTGKRLTARVLHGFGKRKHGPFVPVNLAALPAEMIEQYLFGHMTPDGRIEQGLIRQADGGTLYLDEICELPSGAQSRLLRVLMEGEATPVGATQPVRIDIRLISSTTKDMDNLITQGAFREDLFYRASVVPISLPSLKDRREDIPDLARHFLKLSEAEGAAPRHLDGSALSVLKEHVWPGNVRELENLVRRMCVLYSQETITAGMLQAEMRNSVYFRQGVDQASSTGFSGLQGATKYFVSRYFDEYEGSQPPEGVYQRFLQEFEIPVITTALSATNGNQIQAAKILGLNRNTLRKKIKELGIRIIKTAE